MIDNGKYIILIISIILAIDIVMIIIELLFSIKKSLFNKKNN